MLCKNLQACSSVQHRHTVCHLGDGLASLSAVQEDGACSPASGIAREMHVCGHDNPCIMALQAPAAAVSPAWCFRPKST